ncbi:MAG: molybdopterin-binding protein [Thaumarchaeota archaeon]|nr:molybdopterin-binding protein [Nitrososphaerota archaeon]
MQLTCEIIVVGNELLNGTTLDTNSHWMSGELTKLGVKVDRKTTIRDELEVISRTFLECLKRKPDWIFSIGGLGPTYDDLTVEGLALALGKKLYMDKRAVEMLKASYERRRRMFSTPLRKISRASLKMAMIPEGSTPLPNSVGSAAGVLARSGKTQIVSLPGVPSEMIAIFSEQVIPILKEDTSKYVHAEEWLEAIGISESRLSYSVSRISKKYSGLIYIKSHPMGFEKGKSLIHIQIILSAPVVEKDRALPLLEKAATEMFIATKKLGGKVKRTKSIR